MFNNLDAPRLKMVIDCNEPQQTFQCSVRGISALERRVYKQLIEPSDASTAAILMLTAFASVLQKISKSSINPVLQVAHGYDSVLDAHLSGDKLNLDVFLPCRELVNDAAAICAESIKEIRSTLRGNQAVKFWSAVHYQAQRFHTTWNHIEPDAVELVTLARWASRFDPPELMTPYWLHVTRQPDSFA